MSEISPGKGYLGVDKVQPHIVLVQVVQSIELCREVVLGLYIFIDTIWREHKIVLRFYVYLAVLDIACAQSATVGYGLKWRAQRRADRTTLTR